MVFIGALYLRLVGWRLEGQFPDKKKLIIAVAPHTSNWDFPLAVAVMFATGLRVSFMAKSGLFFWPFNKFMTWLGGISVERSKAHGVVGQMVDKFNSQEQLMLALAPEGTRKVVHKWRTGFLQIANKANVPVLLVGLDFKSKRFILGPLCEVSDDFDAELRKALDFFGSVEGKYPHLCDTSGNQ